MLVISTAHLLRIEHHARDSYPHECCGVLVGYTAGERLVTAVHHTANRATNGTRDSYRIGPREILRIMRGLGDGLQIVGFYHSHPDFPPVPSAQDAEKAWPSYSYLIVSVRNGDPLAVRAWRWSHAHRVFEPEPVQVATRTPARVRLPLGLSPRAGAGSPAGA